MEIDVTDLAIFTIVQKFKRIVERRFDKLDEDFELEKFLGKEINEQIPMNDFKKLDEKLCDDWMNLSDEELKEIQNTVLSKIYELLPEKFNSK